MRTRDLVVAHVAALLLVALVVRLPRESEPEPRSRDSYGTIDLGGEPWMADFLSEYETAWAASEPWLHDPLAVALRLAGYPNADRVEPDRVCLWRTSETTATVVVFVDGCHDDSIRSQEHRVDLVREPGGWRVSWAGLRQRCWRDGSSGWRIGPCP